MTDQTCLGCGQCHPDAREVTLHDGRVVSKITTRKQALDAGLKRYFTGKPCPKGHVDEREARSGQCLPCKLARTQEWRDKNQDKVKNYNHAWRIANADHLTDYKRRYWLENLEENREKKRNHMAANRERYSKKSNEWKARNSSRVKTQMLEWRKKNADHLKAYSQSVAHITVARTKVRQRRLRLATPIWLTDHDRMEMLKLYLRAQEISRVTGVPHEVDHIVPVKGKLICGLHTPSNMRIITRAENRAKGNSHE